LENDQIMFSTSCYEDMLNHCRSSLPYEGCGILSGVNNFICSNWKLKNEVRSDRHFFVGKKTVSETLQKIKEKKETVLAIYHSHPTTAPIPSYADLKNHPDKKIKMIIISFKRKVPNVKCYTVKNQMYIESPFFVDPVD